MREYLIVLTQLTIIFMHLVFYQATMENCEYNSAPFTEDVVQVRMDNYFTKVVFKYLIDLVFDPNLLRI